MAGPLTEILGNEAPLGRLGRLAEAYRSAWPGRRRKVVAAAASAIGLVIGLLVSFPPARPASAPMWADVPVAGVSLRVLPAPSGDGTTELVATVTTGGPLIESRVSVTAVSGPFVGTFRVRPPPIGRSAETDVSVGVVPDCSDRNSLGPNTATYTATVVRTDTDGQQERRVVDLSAAGLDVASAVRRYCWQVASTHGIILDRIQARPDSRSRQVVLDVSVRNTVGRPLMLGVVDIADVDTIDAADSGALDPGAVRSFRVRVPVGDCAVGPPATEQLTWSVGPVGADPVALVTTALSPQQVREVRRAVAARCAPPATSVRVVSAQLVPSSPVVTDHNGVSIGVQLSLVSATERLIAGDDETGLTADARVTVTSADITLRHGRGQAQVLWRARCDATEPGPPTLALRLLTNGRWTGYSVELGDAILEQAYVDACRLTDRAALRAAGWASQR